LQFAQKSGDLDFVVYRVESHEEKLFKKPGPGGGEAVFK
jgi:hypothetical protein